MTPVKLELATPLSRVEDSTTEPLHSQNLEVFFNANMGKTNMNGHFIRIYIVCKWTRLKDGYLEFQGTGQDMSSYQ